MEGNINALVSSLVKMVQDIQKDTDFTSKLMFVASFYSLKILHPVRRLFQKDLEGLSTANFVDVSKRAKSHFMTPPMHYFVDFIRASQNQYDAKTNPGGALPLAVAENKLMAVEMINKIKSFKGHTNDILYYNDGTGMPVVKEALIKILTQRVYKLSSEKISRKIQPVDICVSCGVTALLHQLSMLLFNPGDAVLVPTPYYPAFDHDFWNISDVEAVGVNCCQKENPFSIRLDEQSLERGYTKAICAGKKPKALLLTNPGNPLGTVYTTADLMTAIEWARSKGLHIIVDEIYALTVFNTTDGPEFVSVVNLLNNELGDDVHCLWGLSKDFCANGLRVGVLYTQNKELQQSIGNMSFSFQASNLVQEMVAFILQDEVFVESYISENRLRLKKSYDFLESALEILKVPIIKAQAAMFCFIDLRCLLKADTFEAEREVYDLLYSEASIVVTPGHTCHSPIPGWFRICYAWVPLDALAQFVSRLRSVIQIHAKITLPDLECEKGIVSKKSKPSISSVEPMRLQGSSTSRTAITATSDMKDVDSSTNDSSTSVVSTLFPSASSENFSDSTSKVTPYRTRNVNSKMSPSTATESPISTPSNTPPRKSGLIVPSSRSKPSPLVGVSTDEVSMSALSDSNSSSSVNAPEIKDSSVKKKKSLRKKSMTSVRIKDNEKSGLESPPMLSIVPSPTKRMSTIMSNRKSSIVNSLMGNDSVGSSIINTSAEVGGAGKTKKTTTPTGKTSRRPSSLL